MARSSPALLLSLGIALSTCTLLAAPVAQATTIAPLTVEQMVDGSDLIVRGTVTDVWTSTDQMGLATHALVKVEKTLKGAAVDEVDVFTPGGELDGATSLVDGAPRYGVGERVLLLLNARKDGTYLNVALAGGKYDIKQNPADGTDMVTQFFVPYTQPWDYRFLPNPALADRVSLTAMEKRLTDRVALGWDGNPIPGVSLDHLRQINRLQAGVQ